MAKDNQLSKLQQMAAAVAGGGREIREDVVHTAAKLLAECDEWEANEPAREEARLKRQIEEEQLAEA